MASRVIFPSAVDLLRAVNDNIVDNLLGGRDAYVRFPSQYQLAYLTVYETGELPIEEGLLAPDESINKNDKVTILTRPIR